MTPISTKSFLIILGILFVSYSIKADEISPNDSTPEIPTENVSTPTIPSTTVKPSNQDCGNFTNCKDCLTFSRSCYFCIEEKTCKRASGVYVNSFSCGGLKNTNFLTCSVDFKVFIILCGVGAGAVLFILVGLCCCCCCSCSRRRGPKPTLLPSSTSARDSRRAEFEQRRKEMQEKNDKIRVKYGIVRGDNPYQRFDD